jgi:hypothetical protein
MWHGGGRVLAGLLAICAFGQNPVVTPRFEDFPVGETFAGVRISPALSSPEKRRYRTVIRNGVTKGLGVEDGLTGKELATPGPDFAGHYVIVTWGCGSPCLMAAIVDLKTGRVYPPPFHHGPGHSYFQVPWAFPMTPPLAYRTNSRLLIANICEEDAAITVGGRRSLQARRCGAHYFVMNPDGPKLVGRVLDDR